MGNLPDRSRATVPLHKITHYLLCQSHPVGGPKSTFFEAFGFRLDTAHELEQALLAHAYNCDISKIVDNGFGHNYTLEGPLLTPDGLSPIVQSVWFVDARPGSAPTLVTAFPGDKEKKS